MDLKSTQLSEVLSRLSAKEAVALARAVETQRAAGQEVLPTDTILDTLRGHLRAARPRRVPTLLRLICGGFEDFLTDHEDDPRLPGLIPRAVIMPWWRGLGRIAGNEVAEFEARWKKHVESGTAQDCQEFADEAHRWAAKATTALQAQLKKQGCPPALKQLFPRPQLIADLTEIAKILALADALKRGIEAALQPVLAARKLDGRRILDFPPPAVTLAKQHYVAMSEAHGMDNRYLALALLNRLDQPSQILRLGRALSWKPNDSLVRDTEFGIIGHRLILDLQRLSREIVAITAARGRAPLVFELTAHVDRYMNESEGLLGEFGFRRDSEWGEAILKTRMDVAGALDRDFLDRVCGLVLALMPVGRRSGMARGTRPPPDVSAAPESEAIEAALQAARFLMLLVQRGQRHGFSHEAREAIEKLGGDIEERASDLLEELKLAPKNEAIVAQIQAAVQALDVLFDDGRGATLGRRIRLARQAPA